MLRYAWMVCKNRLNSVRQSLKILFIIALFCVLLLDLWLFQVNEWFPKAAILGNLLRTFCIAYMTGLVFYFINVHLQNERLKSKMVVYINNKTGMLHKMSQDLLRSVIGVGPNEIIVPVEQAIKEACTKINPHLGCKIGLNTYSNWFDALNDHEKKVKELVVDLLNIRESLSADFLEKLAFMIDTFDWHVNFTKGIILGNSSLDFASTGFYKYAKFTDELYEVFRKKYEGHLNEHHERFRKEQRLKNNA